MTPKTIQDLYGQELQVEVEMGDGTVWLEIAKSVPCAPPDPLKWRTETTHSKLFPAEARELAEQLIETSKEAERYGE